MSEAKLTKAELRVAVAKDVLKVLKTLHVTQGIYVKTFGQVDFSEKGEKSKKEARVIQKNCDVCALGALFLSTVACDNKFNFTQPGLWDVGCAASSLFLHEDFLRKRLEKVFSKIQLAEIETAFEQDQYFGGGRASEEFGNKFIDSKDRLRAILKNIVDNGGTFKP